MFIAALVRFARLFFLPGTLLLLAGQIRAQALGGAAAYNFLKLPASPLLAAAGGANVSDVAGEVSLTANNPALLNQQVSGQIAASFDALFAGAKGYRLTSAFHSEKRQLTLGAHITYLDYGVMPRTDAAGNVLGDFRPVEYIVQVAAAKNYLQKWTGGLTVKLIHAAYGPYRSSAMATDVGVLYNDSAKAFSASLVVKNLGVQLNKFSGKAEDLPFELQAGITRRLAKAPFGFSITLQHLQAFNLLYSDTVFNRANNLTSSTSAVNKLLLHLVVASHIYLGQHLEATVGYNVLQRRELSMGSEGNGLVGFAAGLRVRLPKLEVLYSRSAYQHGTAANQIGLTVHLDRLFGLGP